MAQESSNAGAYANQCWKFPSFHIDGIKIQATVAHLGLRKAITDYTLLQDMIPGLMETPV